MPVLVETLASYLPSLIVKRLLTEPSLVPDLEQLSGAVFFADISGFTSLTERLVQRDPYGVEDLSRVLNTYFGQLIELIHSHGGDVVKFAGDSLLAIWPARTDTELTTA